MIKSTISPPSLIPQTRTSHWLAVSDLGQLLLVTWTNALLSVNPQWMFGKLACKMYVHWRSQTADCSIATLMFISIDRCVPQSPFLLACSHNKAIVDSRPPPPHPPVRKLTHDEYTIIYSTSRWAILRLYR